MANFKIAYDITMGHEGGYANDPNDNGGETYKGVARKFHPNWPGWVAIDKIKSTLGKSTDIINKHAGLDAGLQFAIQSFYKTQFWDIINLDKITNQNIANELFDIGVNMGPGVAAKFLQESLNLCNNGSKLYPNLVVDGTVGPKTISCLNNHLKPNLVLKTLNLLQGEKYLKIVRNNEVQERFWNSWLSRVTI